LTAQLCTEYRLFFC